MKKERKSKKNLDTTRHNLDVSEESMGFDGLTDPRKIKAAQLLAHAGYTGKKRVRGCISHVARVCNINRQTIYYWLKTDLDFEMAIEEARADLCALALRSLRDMAKAGNVNACIFLLEKLQPEIYSPQHRKFQHDKEMIELKARLKMPLDGDEKTLPVIIINSLGEDSPEYERNKI